MRRAWIAATLIVAACTDARPTTTMPIPGRLARALTAVEDLGATAYLVPQGGAPGPGTPLTRADDGVTFSGFIPGDPGNYTLEVVFEGVPAQETTRIFLGRWTSNAFTISAGASAMPTFSRPLDPVGRPEDAGDADGDGLGALDEVLWGTDRNDRDSDGDGVVDGQDCTPSDAGDASMITDGGSQEDCDADGVIRADLPYGRPGPDCNDRDPTVNPGATDDCSDAIDQDCNPSTCPIDDTSGPAIANVTPAFGASLGCHRTISADMTDASGIANASAVLEGATVGGDVSLFMQNESGDRWTTMPLSMSGALEGLLEGTHAVRIEATDGDLNTSMASGSYQLVLDVPSIDRMLPATIDDASAPFSVTIEASAREGVASIVVYAAPRNAQDLYSIAGATELGRSTSSPATMMVDPSSLADGSYMLYAVVEDTVGNRLAPYAVAAAIGGPNGTTTSADYGCLRSPSGYSMPVRLFTKGAANPYRPTKILAHLAEATTLAAGVDPAARLVSIIGFGADADGNIRLDRASSYSVWIQYSFHNPNTMRFIGVTWRTQAWGSENPLIDPNAGNVTTEDFIVSPMTLVDSDVAAAAAAADGCDTLGTSDTDYIQYMNINGEDVVTVSKDGGTTWRATAHAPMTEIFGCN